MPFKDHPSGRKLGTYANQCRTVTKKKITFLLENDPKGIKRRKVVVIMAF